MKTKKAEREGNEEIQKEKKGGRKCKGGGGKGKKEQLEVEKEWRR